MLYSFILCILVVASSSVAAPVPDTSQTHCYNLTQEIVCPEKEEGFYGQDAQFTINPPIFIKLDQSGEPLPDNATTWSMVYDSITGLTWEIKTTDGTIQDQSRRMSWYDLTTRYSDILNTNQFGGYSDWRIPTIRELHSIVNLNQTQPALHQSYFPHTISDNYWSSSSQSDDIGQAWCIHFSNGNDNNQSKATAHYIRAVRGEIIFPTHNQLIDNGDDTITDPVTGLMWQKREAIGLDWQSALNYCNTLSLGEYEDWRLPNREELRSIVNRSRVKPSAYIDFFSQQASTAYWSSSTFVPDPSKAWCIHFNYGNDLERDKIMQYAVRAVRGGQVMSDNKITIQTPKQADRWLTGQQMPIMWDSNNISGNVTISLSREGGSDGTYETLARSINNSGQFTWEVAGPDAVNCMIKIEPLLQPYARGYLGLFSIDTLYYAWIQAHYADSPSQFRVFLNGQYATTYSPLNVSWTCHQSDLAEFNENLLIAKHTGWVEIETNYQGTAYKQWMGVYVSDEDIEMEPNSSLNLAISLREDVFIKGDFSSDRIDYYRFRLPTDSIVMLCYLSFSKSADVQMELFNSRGVLIAKDQSLDGSFYNKKLGLPADTYYIRLNNDGDWDTFYGYALSYKTIGMFSKNSIDPLTFGKSVQSVIGHLNDRSEFYFSLLDETPIQLIFSPTGHDAKYHLDLFDYRFNAIDQADCINYLPVTMEHLLQPGQYTLQVRPIEITDVSSPFYVLLQISDHPLEKEPNNSTKQATPISEQNIIYGQMNNDIDIDYFSFQMNLPGWIAIRMKHDVPEQSYDMILFKDSEDQPIDRQIISNTTELSMHVGLIPGNYFIKLLKKQDAIIELRDTYRLTILNSDKEDIEMEPNNTRYYANKLNPTLVRQGKIISNLDIDYYGWYLQYLSSFDLAFYPMSDQGIFRISILDEKNNVLVDQTSAFGMPYTFTINQAIGDYALKIENNGNSGPDNTYTVQLNCNQPVTDLKRLSGLFVHAPLSSMAIDDSQSLSAIAYYSDASSENVPLPTWTSLNPTIASIDNQGFLTAHETGIAKIVAVFQGIAAMIDIQVGGANPEIMQHHGNLILLAGGEPDDMNQMNEAIQYLSDLVYQGFKKRFFSDQDIYYLNATAFHDLDFDLQNDHIVDEDTPTVVQFGWAITDWAVNQLSDGPLYIYLIGYGGTDSFYIQKDAMITAFRLKGFLEVFQYLTNRPVIVCIDANKSGTMLDDLLTSNQKRVIVTSADERDAYVYQNGQVSFTQFFINSLVAGESVKLAWQNAVDSIHTLGSPFHLMSPQLSESETDFSNALFLGGSFKIQDLYPQIIASSSSDSITSGMAFNTWVEVKNRTQINQVWTTIFPPQYIAPPTSSDFQTAMIDIPSYDLIDPDGDGQFSKTTTNFPFEGLYRLCTFIASKNQMISIATPITITVKGGIHMDTDDDGMPDIWEDRYAGLDKTMPDGAMDLDLDGLTNYQEYQNRSNPLIGDTDNDTLPDLWEVTYGFDPTYAEDAWYDEDLDGVNNYQEYIDKTDPIDSTSYQLHYGEIYGKITSYVLGYESGIKNASITLSGFPSATMTKSEGSFSISSVPFGKYIMTIQATHFQTFQQQIILSRKNYYTGIIQLQLSPTGVTCDYNENMKLDLSDIIRGMQILSGVR